jgi:hypothetical protein
MWSRRRCGRVLVLHALEIVATLEQQRGREDLTTTISTNAGLALPSQGVGTLLHRMEEGKRNLVATLRIRTVDA